MQLLGSKRLSCRQYTFYISPESLSLSEVPACHNCTMHHPSDQAKREGTDWKLELLELEDILCDNLTARTPRSRSALLPARWRPTLPIINSAGRFQGSFKWYKALEWSSLCTGAFMTDYPWSTTPTSPPGLCWAANWKEGRQMWYPTVALPSQQASQPFFPSTIHGSLQKPTLACTLPIRPPKNFSLASCFF